MLLPLALAALPILFPVAAGAQENPLLSPPPTFGAPASPSPAQVEQDRMRVDTLRGQSDLSLRPNPDPMRQREADGLRLDADRAQRALQDPLPSAPPAATIDGPAQPRIDPPEPRITHGRKKGAPTPAQSSPVPARKPSAPPGP